MNRWALFSARRSQTLHCSENRNTNRHRPVEYHRFLLTVLAALLWCLRFASEPVWLWAKKFSPQTRQMKSAIYGGAESTGDAWVQFKSGYYGMALSFSFSMLKLSSCCPLRSRSRTFLSVRLSR